ncbi:hypothetical protein HDV06_002724 [Boothiomyces sp. JEL0866]|nr:hypothetical protein HDV06_002724 [Boothiomyces sp. JEL0866]
MSLVQRLFPELQTLSRLSDPFENEFKSLRQYAQLPAIDVKETKEAFVVHADIPGFRREEIDISLNGQVLTLKGNKEKKEEKKDETHHIQERIQSSFYRSITLPDTFAPENVKALLKDGILEINIPKNTVKYNWVLLAKPKMSLVQRLFPELQTLSRLSDPFENEFKSLRQYAQLPAIDVKETKEAFVVHADIPGFRREEIDISLNGQVLTLKGNKEKKEEKKDETHHIQERIQSSFYRSITLPDTFAPENVKALLRDGILEITVPKNTISKKITIS